MDLLCFIGIFLSSITEQTLAEHDYLTNTTLVIPDYSSVKMQYNVHPKLKDNKYTCVYINNYGRIDWFLVVNIRELQLLLHREEPAPYYLATMIVIL
jgi:hypothetical protein